MNEKPLIMFPSEFSIKIIGYNKNAFELEVLTIIRKHFPDLGETAIRTRSSKNNKYLSMTVTVWVLNQAQLDAAYSELSASQESLMVL